jgi:hypothetical protein
MALFITILNIFHAYLRRKEVMGYHQKNYKNVVKLTRKLAYLVTYDKLGRQKLKKQIEQTVPLTERSWLLNQVENL